MTDYFDVLEQTWPAASSKEHAGWILREGAGGGKRVSAATLKNDDANLEDAIAAMKSPLFMVRKGQSDLDSKLENAGLSVVDPTLIYACPIAMLTPAALPLVKTYAVWDPLHCMVEVWAMGGIGASRLAVMDRVKGPKSGIMGRNKEVPAGAGFVAMHGTTAMVHALEVLPDHRRQGIARHMMAQAAHWAVAHGATEMALAVTKANTGANALYASMGMEIVEHYHYRM